MSVTETSHIGGFATQLTPSLSYHCSFTIVLLGVVCCVATWQNIQVAVGSKKTVTSSTMSTQALYSSLLRPPILHIIRAAGFHSTRPAVLDTVVDLTVCYLMLLASSTVSHAHSNHNDACPDITDIRMALQDVGAFVPQMSAMEELWNGEEDMRGLENFLDWVKGDVHKEIRRIAGLASTEGEVVDIEALQQKEDFLTSKLLSSLKSRVNSLLDSVEEKA